MRAWKIILSVVFVAAVAFAVVRGCTHKTKRPASTPARTIKTAKPHTKPRYTSSAPETAAKPVLGRVVGQPRAAIVLDDWGRNNAVAQDALALGKPITFAIIPYLPYSKKIAEAAHAKGFGVILHMPMQPKNLNEDMEPTTLTVDMPDAQKRQMIDAGLASVPHVEGVNNHMGSAVTSDLNSMRVILKHLKSKGLYFFDSNVIAATVGPRVAAETGIRFAKRDVFIDNELKLEEIKKQLRKAIQIALAHGEVTLIGHDHRVTIRAIREVLPEFEEAGVVLVLLRDLVRA